MTANSPVHAAATNQKAQPVRAVQAIIAGASVIITALGAINWAQSPSWTAVLVTLLPALSAAYAAYQAVMLPQKVVPLEDTAVYVDEHGKSVAGPASPLTNGTPAKSVPSAPESPASA